MAIITALLLMIAGYICGALPFGVWVARARGIDLTKVGSGSTGATNVYRCVGKKEGILVLLLDAFKGYAPVTAAIWLDHGNMSLTVPIGSMTIVMSDIVPCLAGIMSMIGHSKSIFLNFKGGKSAATGLGTIIALNPAVGGLVFLSFVSLVYFTRIVSIASMGAATIDPILMALFKAPGAFVAYAAIGGLLVIVRHKANIKRLLNGTEPRFGQKTSTVDEATAAKVEAAGAGDPTLTASSETSSPGGQTSGTAASASTSSNTSSTNAVTENTPLEKAANENTSPASAPKEGGATS